MESKHPNKVMEFQQSVDFYYQYAPTVLTLMSDLNIFIKGENLLLKYFTQRYSQYRN